jgi:hypothetical protein
MKMKSFGFVLVENPSHIGVGSVIRCSIAFGIRELCIIGSNSYSTHGARGAQRRFKHHHFYSFDDCYRYLTEQYRLQVPGNLSLICNEEFNKLWTYGILLSYSLMDNVLGEDTRHRCIPLSKVQFSRETSTCFVVINYKHSLMRQREAEDSGNNMVTDTTDFGSVKKYCDYYVYVDIPNQKNDELLHDDAKISLVLQQYAIQVNYEEVVFHGEKHDIDKESIILNLKKGYTANRISSDIQDTVSETEKIICKERKKKISVDDGEESCEYLNSLFHIDS